MPANAPRKNSSPPNPRGIPVPISHIWPESQGQLTKPSAHPSSSPDPSLAPMSTLISHYQAFTSKFSCSGSARETGHHSWRCEHTSGKYVVTTVRSANLRPAKARSALVANSGVSNLIKILPTPADCLLPPTGLGILRDRIVPNFSHSSWTSSRISGKTSQQRELERLEVGWWRMTHPRSRHCPSARRASPC